MKKRINEDLILYFTNNFPFQSKVLSKKKNLVTIGIGGNIGDVKKRFDKLFMMLNSDCRFHIVETSPLLKNPPFGFLDQDDFLNGLIVLKTDLSPKKALKAFQRYENRFKRRRSFKDAPRTLDLDIIFFNKLKMDTKELTIPHHGYKQRESVLIPLEYLRNI